MKLVHLLAALTAVPVVAASEMALAQPAATDPPVAFVYTSLSQDSCQDRGMHDGVLRSRCSGFGGYDLQVSYYYDHGSRLDFLRGGKALGLEYQSPGPWDEVTTGKVEWRHRGGAPHALIFRVRWTDQSTGLQSKSTLLVARVDGGKVCIIGRTGSNDEARALADDVGRRCR
jgi:hypothetical protein